jgi:dolichol-phosphate mannosyltransferase
MFEPDQIQGQPLRSDSRIINAESGISVIIPTYKEALNIPYILSQLDTLRRAAGLRLEVIFVDDNSRDGSVEAVQDAGFDWARIIVRTHERGLSSAVIAGFQAARHEMLVCMDCDLSHPVQTIPMMRLGLSAGQQMVIGSRYVAGGTTDDDWGLLRWLNSVFATLLARPLTQVHDPMSGFFALRKADFDAAQDLNPIGYKIALELIVKCQFSTVAEVPIHFSDRVHGESKLSIKEQLKYLQHLRRLYMYRFSNAMYVAQFLVVGASGMVVNLAVLSLLLALGVPEPACLAGGIAVSLLSNFALNRRFTFSYARFGPLLRQFLGFLSASAFGAVVNYSVALTLRDAAWNTGGFSLQIAALCGIAAGMAFNFIGSRYLVFRKRHFRK